MASKVYAPSADVSANAKISTLQQYREMYEKSINDPDAFWGDLAKELLWKVEPGKKNLCKFNFHPEKGAVFVKWFEGSKTNICYNALDKNVEKGFGKKTAYFW